MGTKIALSLLIIFSTAASYSKDPQNCNEIDCANRTILKWAACDSIDRLETTQMHKLEVDGDKIFICEGKGKLSNSKIVAMTLSPYNLPIDTEIQSVDQKTKSVKLKVKATREIYKSIPKDLSAKEEQSLLQLTYCKSTRSMTTYCMTPTEITATQTDKNEPLRAFRKTSQYDLFINGKGIHILSGAKRVAHYDVDGHFESSGYGQHGHWFFFTVKETDGDSLTSHLFAYSQEAKRITKIMSFVDFDFSVQHKSAEQVILKLKLNPESEPGSVTMDKVFSKCLKGKIPNQQAATLVMDVSKSNELKLISCGS